MSEFVCGNPGKTEYPEQRIEQAERPPTVQYVLNTDSRLHDGFAGTILCGRGELAEWLRSGLQIRVHRFDSGTRLHQFLRRWLSPRLLPSAGIARTLVSRAIFQSMPVAGSPSVPIGKEWLGCGTNSAGGEVRLSEVDDHVARRSRAGFGREWQIPCADIGAERMRAVVSATIETDSSGNVPWNPEIADRQLGD